MVRLVRKCLLCALQILALECGVGVSGTVIEYRPAPPTSLYPTTPQGTGLSMYSCVPGPLHAHLPPLQLQHPAGPPPPEPSSREEHTHGPPPPRRARGGEGGGTQGSTLLSAVACGGSHSQTPTEAGRTLYSRAGGGQCGGQQTVRATVNIRTYIWCVLWQLQHRTAIRAGGAYVHKRMAVIQQNAVTWSGRCVPAVAGPPPGV